MADPDPKRRARQGQELPSPSKTPPTPAVPPGFAGLPQELFSVVYRELRAIARRYLDQERRSHTLQPTALVHEAWVRLSPDLGKRWSPDQLKACAALVMRHVLLDHARARLGPKRGGGLDHVPLTVVADSLVAPSSEVELIALHEALERLAGTHARQANVVILRFFGGMAHPEIARSLGVHLSTVEADWRFARAWLMRELGEQGKGAHP